MKSNRRAFLNQTLALGSGLLLSDITKVEAKVDPLPSLKDRTVLFTYGGWDGHEPALFADYMTNWLKSEGDRKSVV